MKSWYLPFVLIMAFRLSAQLEIEMVEKIQVDPPQGGTEVAAPEAGDHSVPLLNKGREQDLLNFLNKDRLSGHLIRMDAEGLLWKHPDAAAEVLYGLDNLKMIEFKTTEGQKEDLTRLPRIELTNGDRYRGRIVRMDPQQLVIASPLGGELSIRSDMVKSIRPVVTSSAIYEGPNAIEEWEINNNNNNDGGWEVKNQALYCNGHNMIAGLKLEELTDMSSVEFEMEFRGNVNLQFAFWAKDPKNVHQNAYIVNLQNGYVRGYRNFDKIGRNELGNLQPRADLNDGKLKVKLLLNREKKEILMLFEENLVARWTDTFEGKIKGNALVFASMSNTPIKISNISVRAWDGEFDLDNGDKPAAQDQLITANGDIFAGQLEKIESDVLYFKNDFAVFQVPVERISEITMSQATRSVPRLQAGDTEIYFPGGERITLKLSSLDGQKFTGNSEATGDVTLWRKYFSEMKMNPYDDRHKEEEDIW
jgi:hypothetical protein